MSVVASRSGTLFGLPGSAGPAAFRATALRAGLLAGCAAAVCAAAWLGDPRPALDADIELAHLLRGMAVIKAALCGLAIGVLLWRFGHPTSRRGAAAYLLGAWLMAGASMLIWQLTFIPAAAIAFHAGEFTLLVAAWRDGRERRKDARSRSLTPTVQSVDGGRQAAQSDHFDRSLHGGRCETEPQPTEASSTSAPRPIR